MWAVVSGGGTSPAKGDPVDGAPEGMFPDIPPAGL